MTGLSRHTPSRPWSGEAALLTAAEAGRNHLGATRTRPQHGKAVHAEAFASQGSEPSSSDDVGGLTDSDHEPGSDDYQCLTKGEQVLSTRINIPWEAVDEQGLLATRRTSLGTGFSANSQAGLGPQYASAGT